MPRLTITMDEDDYEQVSRLAHAEERSLSWVIGKAVKEFLRERRLLEQRPLFDASVGERRRPR